MQYDNVVHLLSPPDRRFKVLYMTPDILVNLLLGPSRLISKDGGIVQVLEVEGMPSDAQIQALAYDPISDRLSLRVHSDEFPESSVGEVLEELELVIKAKLFKVMKD